MSWQFDSSWPFIIVSRLTIYNDPSVYDVQSSTQLDTLYNQETSYEHQFVKTFNYYYLSFDIYLDHEDFGNGTAYDSLDINPYRVLKIDYDPKITSSQVLDESSVN